MPSCAFWLEKALYQWSGPRAIRYPRGKEETALAALGCTGKDFDVYRAAKPADAVIVCYSGETAQALRAAELAGQQGAMGRCVQDVRYSPIARRAG